MASPYLQAPQAKSEAKPSATVALAAWMKQQYLAWVKILLGHLDGDDPVLQVGFVAYRNSQSPE